MSEEIYGAVEQHNLDSVYNITTEKTEENCAVLLQKSKGSLRVIHRSQYATIATCHFDSVVNLFADKREPLKLALWFNRSLPEQSATKDTVQKLLFTFVNLKGATSLINAICHSRRELPTDGCSVFHRVENMADTLKKTVGNRPAPCPTTLPLKRKPSNEATSEMKKQKESNSRSRQTASPVRDVDGYASRRSRPAEKVPLRTSTIPSTTVTSHSQTIHGTGRLTPSHGSGPHIESNSGKTTSTTDRGGGVSEIRDASTPRKILTSYLDGVLGIYDLVNSSRKSQDVQIIKLKRDLAESHASARQLSDMSNDLTMLLNTERHNSGHKIGELEAEKALLAEKLENATAEEAAVREQKKQNDKLLAQVSSLTARVNELTSKDQQMQAEIGLLKKDIEALTELFDRVVYSGIKVEDFLQLIRSGKTAAQAYFTAASQVMEQERGK